MFALLRSRNIFFDYTQISTVKRVQGIIRTLSDISNEMDSNTLESSAETDKRVRINETRYNGRIKKRKWGELPDPAFIKKKEEDAGIPYVRIKKKKMALLMGYSGVDFWGMQRNPGVPTVEEDLFKALLDAEYINLEEFTFPQNLNFQRAARTDKGVSAARQIVSLKLPEIIDIAKINEKLCPSIRVFGITRATQGFDSKNNCDARTYSYTLPTFAFESHSTQIEDAIGYRTTTEKISHLNEILALYEGSKNYHNYTKGMPFINPSARRFMCSFECAKLFEAEGMEFAMLKVKGQSFMMHQIRKMVGMALAVIRGLTDVSSLKSSFSPQQIDLPTAPGLGLVLDYVHYERYNNRYGGDGVHKTLTWEEIDGEIEAFRNEFINPKIIHTEVIEKPFLEWVTGLHRHSYKPRHDKFNKTDVEETSIYDNEIDANNKKDNLHSNDEVKDIVNKAEPSGGKDNINDLEEVDINVIKAQNVS